jgi:hypothetical protein
VRRDGFEPPMPTGGGVTARCISALPPTLALLLSYPGLTLRTPSRTRTCSRLVRSQVRYPLRHRGVIPAGGADPPASRVGRTLFR